ncbi:MAG: substrate-binding domain-containing protein, partial [bacterium]
IIHFRGPSALFTVHDRTIGFKEVLDQKKVFNFGYDLSFKNPSDTEIENMIRSNLDCDGIFCDSDLIALHVIQILKKVGLRIPEDVQIIGFDNISFSGFITPTLTTIAQPTDKIGRYAVDQLMELISGKPLKEYHHQIDVSLVERQTTRN